MPRSPRVRTLSLVIGVVALPGLLLGLAGPAYADPGGFAPVPVPDWAKAGGLDKAGVVAPALAKAKDTVTVSVLMSEKPVAEVVDDGAIVAKTLPSRTRQRAQTRRVDQQQDRVVRAARKIGARELGGATKAANIVAMTLPADQVPALAKIEGVVAVKPLARYETHVDPGGSGSLAQAARYLQATSVRAAGYDGTGVKIAVLDSGVDFTHEYLSGPGTEAFYETCYAQRDVAPTGECAAYFGPEAPKVKGGFDFVGETWNGTTDTTEDPDPNPIDREGHGTHVADIAAGKGPNHAGLAPGASVYGVKVCSAISTSCSGVAILQGLDYALDPNDDGDVADAMDIVNLSLGLAYGQAEDDSALALNNLVRAGVVGVTSAGNNADRPFIVGSPSTAPRAISVAQTALPDDKVYPITINSPTIPGLPGNQIRLAKLQAWSPAPRTAITGNLVAPSGNGEGCTPATFAGFPAGAVALVKRGTCSASVKAQNAQAAGASAVVIWNNVPGEPPDFSFGGGAPVTVPTLSISLEKATPVAAALAEGPVNVTIDPADAISSRNTVVGTTSRGLAIDGFRAKPDLGAPGAWLSAEVGTGNGQTNFGGTSGAAPVVAGAAALLLDRYPNANPATVKARLLNGASRANATFDPDANRYPTPVARIGAGEIRVAPSVNNTGVLRAQLPGGGNVGLGLPRLTRTTTYPVQLRLTNTSGRSKVYEIRPQFREAADRARGAVTVATPDRVRVAAKSSRTLTIRVTINPRRLEPWPFTHAAGLTSDGAEFNRPEYDGLLLARSGSETLHLGWTVLPHRSADVSASDVKLNSRGRGTLVLRNASRVLDGAVNVFGLTGTSPRYARPAPGQPGSPGSDVAVIDLAAAGVRDDAALGVIQFAVAGHQRRAIPLYPAGYEIDIDTDRDGEVDYAVFQQEAVGFGSSAQSLVYVLNVATGAATAYYYTDADYDSATQVLSAPLSALGLTRGSTFDFSVLAFDNYFSGTVTDAIEDQTWTVGAQKYALAGGADGLVVRAGGTSRATVTQAGSAVTSTQTGLLLTYDDAVRRDFQAIEVTPAPVS